MRIERINENSIRCTLTSFDLSVRNLNLRELAYGTEKARQLFDEMMTKASSVGFHAENTPIMIEAIPMSSDSIQLIISKVQNPEELDTRFSRFTQNPAVRKEAENWINKLASALLEGTDGFAEQLKAAGKSASEVKEHSDSQSTAAQTPEAAQPEFRAFAFDSLDTVISVCRSARTYRGTSRLYKHPTDGHYVLIIDKASAENDEFARACNNAAEYGHMIRTVRDTESYYAEHYKLISGNAIVKLGEL